MVGEACSGYTRDKSRTGIIRGGGRLGWRNRREMEREIRIEKDGGRETKMNMINREFQTYI